MTQIHRTIKVNGRVQGVGFRAGASHKAKSLGLLGFVENNEDGSVHIEVEGEKEQVEQFTGWCHEGTMLSRVDSVLIQAKSLQHYVDFSIRKTDINLLE